MKKIAAIVPNLSMSQNIFYMIKNFNKLGQDHIPYCFYVQLSNICTPPQFAVMNISYLPYFHNGKIIACDLMGLKILVNTQANSEKIFYVWDLEWLRGSIDYMDNIKYLRDPQIKLWARSETHARNIENYCNKTVSKIIPNWSYKELI